MLNSYRDSTRQYDDLIDDCNNNNCELLDREMEVLTQTRARAQSTLVATQDLVKSIAKTPRTIAKDAVLRSVSSFYSEPSRSWGMSISVLGDVPTVEGEVSMSVMPWERVVNSVNF